MLFYILKYSILKIVFYITSKSNETTKYNHTITIHFLDVYRFNIILVKEYYTIYRCCKIKVVQKICGEEHFQKYLSFAQWF